MIGESSQACEVAVAYHEASHAVIARVLCLEITCATIVPNGHRQGTVKMKSAAHLANGADPVTRLLAIKKDALVDFAGPYAEARQGAKLEDTEHAWEADFDSAMFGCARAVALKHGLLQPDGSTEAPLPRKLGSRNL
jgi:hypothetical protein